MKRFTRRIALALALVCFTLCCTGCFSTPESRRAEQGKAIMQEYLKTRDGKTSVDSAATEKARPAPDRIEMTEYVYGAYRIDGQKYEYRVNVKTGEIFTSERYAAFQAECYALLLKELGVDPSRCVGLCNARFVRAPAERLLPAEIEDPDAYARSHLHADEFKVHLWLVCSASEAPPGCWTAEDTADWNSDEAHICIMPAGEALPEFGNGLYLGYRYFEEFSGEKYILSAEAVEYTPQQ